ncbi:hypothetical protein ACR78F_01260 [Sphingobacterium spiritivorum]|uniref:hypothetical protein n=1 Tax=Sphingobacterium spiritivorum TaxID=258 RepID=UPI003DA2EF1A
MKKTKLTIMLAAGCMLSVAACGNSKTDNSGQSTTVPPTNGEDTRYNQSQADSLVMPIDSNVTDTSNTDTR